MVASLRLVKYSRDPGIALTGEPIPLGRLTAVTAAVGHICDSPKTEGGFSWLSRNITCLGIKYGSLVFKTYETYHFG